MTKPLDLPRHHWPYAMDSFGLTLLRYASRIRHPNRNDSDQSVQNYPLVLYRDFLKVVPLVPGLFNFCDKCMIAWRFATVEPVYGNTRGNKRLDRFALCGRMKVEGQSKLLYCLVHNIEKLLHHGYAG